MKLTKTQIEQKATEISNWLQDAAGDCALGMIEMNDCGEFQKKYKKLKRENPRWDKYTHSSWLADNLHSDSGWVLDMIGDRIYDSTDNESDRCEIAKEIKESGHSEIKKACDTYLKKYDNL